MTGEANGKRSGGSMMAFRSRSSWGKRMPFEMAKRQGDIATFAFLSFAGKDEAMTFLNTQSESLGARPIDLAIESDAGYDQVKQAIAEMVGSRGT